MRRGATREDGPVQGSLLPARPVARCSDPETSHRAAAQITKSGHLGRSCARTLHVLAAHPGPAPTSAELARGDLRLFFFYDRGISDIYTRGLVAHEEARACRQTGKIALTWLLTPRAPETLQTFSRGGSDDE